MWTNSPEGDAERWNNEQERRERELLERKRKAYDVVLSVLSCKPEEWQKDKEFGGIYTSPDGLLYEALEALDDDVTDAYNALLTSPGARKLHEALASFHGDASPFLGD